MDNGASFDPQPGTIHGTVPPAIQHLTTEILAEEGQYQVLARWDTPRVVKGVSFSLRLNVAAEDGSNRLVSSAGTPDTQYRFRGLTPGRYTLTVRAVNSQGQQGDPASTQFSIAAPAAPSFIELTPGYFQITATPRQAVYDPTVQYEFWFSDAQITDIHQVENAARYLGTALYWIAASVNIRPGRDYYFYIRAVNQVGKSAFVEATGQASNDAAGYLDFFKGQITESHLGKELLEKVDLTEDNASKLQQFSKEWQDANDKWNAMWGVKIEQTKDGKYYVAGLGLSMEDTPDGKISQFLVAADRIAYINPANGNETPGFVMQGDQIIMNEAFLKYLSAPTITSGGNPPAFSLTPDGKLSARNADIAGNINATSGTFSNVHILGDCQVDAVLSANQIRGDIAKIVACNRNASVYIQAEAFDRILAIPSVWVTAWGFSEDSFHVNITVTVNAGGVVYTGTTYATNKKTGVCDVFCTIPANTPVVVSYQADFTEYASDCSSQALVFINKA
ncbi:host specificity protein J [Salmonella enterica subsp. enterica]|nr:host specificity protein J [Salmonella enterica subsp. enterica serovar Sandiego]